MQAGYVRSWVGTIVVYSWIVLPAVCYAIMIPWTYIAYTVGSGWYFPPSVAFWQNVFGDWDGCVLPWCVNFTIAHLVGLIMAKLWGVLNTMALLPVTTMESATHVVITEDFKVDPDDVHDPDEKHDVLESISLWFHGVTKKYHSAETTVVVAITDQEEYRQIEYTCVRYILDEDEDIFVPQGEKSFTPQEAHRLLAKGGLSSEEADETLARCGQKRDSCACPRHL